MIKSNPQVARRSTDGRPIGQLQDGVLFKKVRISRHLYRKLDAWTIDEQTYRSLRSSIKLLRYEDVEEGVAYEASPEMVDAHATLIHHSGHGAQLALSRRFWHVEPLIAHQLRLPLGG